MMMIVIILMMKNTKNHTNKMSQKYSPSMQFWVKQRTNKSRQGSTPPPPNMRCQFQSFFKTDNSQIDALQAGLGRLSFYTKMRVIQVLTS